MNSPVDENDVKSYLTTFYMGTTKRVSRAAIKQIALESDTFLRYICSTIKSKYADHFTRSHFISGRMIERLPILTKPYIVDLDYLKQLTCFKQEQVKRRVKHFMKLENLNMDESGYWTLLNLLYKRVDNMIYVALLLCGFDKSDKLRARHIKMGADVLRYCLQEIKEPAET